MRVVDLQIEDESVVQSVASLLVKAAGDSWPGMNATLALEKVRQSCGENKISLVAIEEGGKTTGLISAAEGVGKLWNLKLFVCDTERAEGIASLLKISLENRIDERGGVTMQSFYRTQEKSYLINQFLEQDEADAPQDDEPETAQIYVGAAASNVQVWLSSKTAARAAFFARLHGDALSEWIARIIDERIESEEAALIQQEQVFIKK
ncbi:MAG: hypothetical protein ACR2LC_11765 [Pyrinomonadaceae bacterium]